LSALAGRRLKTRPSDIGQKAPVGTPAIHD
jgi:hypothetical protein